MSDVIAISVSNQIPAKFIFRTGTQNRTRYIYLTSIANKLGPDVCADRPGYHAFSGSDSTSFFLLVEAK